MGTCLLVVSDVEGCVPWGMHYHPEQGSSPVYTELWGGPNTPWKPRGKRRDLVGKRGRREEVRGQHEGVSSLRSPCGSPGIELRLSGLPAGAFTHEPTLWTSVKMFRPINYRPVVVFLDDH